MSFMKNSREFVMKVLAKMMIKKEKDKMWNMGRESCKLRNLYV